MKNNDVRTGCSSFSVGFWKGVFYPEGLPPKEYLAYYSQHLRAVEVNTTFYGRPTEKTLGNWFANTPDEFRFFIKMPKTITHEKRLVNTKADSAEFCLHIAGGLRHKLAGFLYQLPPSFKYSTENLERVLATVDGLYQNVVEFRHESWWTAEVQEILSENKITFCGVSFPGHIPDDIITNREDLGYYRLHGVPGLFKSSYSDEFLQQLATKIVSADQDFYVFFNNTFGTSGILNAQTFQNDISELIR